MFSKTKPTENFIKCNFHILRFNVNFGEQLKYKIETD